jgi:hypothetical protein
MSVSFTSIKAFTFVEAFFMPKNQPSVEDLEGILKWYKKLQLPKINKQKHNA